MLEILIYLIKLLIDAILDYIPQLWKILNFTPLIIKEEEPYFNEEPKTSIEDAWYLKDQLYETPFRSYDFEKLSVNWWLLKGKYMFKEGMVDQKFLELIKQNPLSFPIPTEKELQVYIANASPLHKSVVDGVAQYKMQRTPISWMYQSYIRHYYGGVVRYWTSVGASAREIFIPLGMTKTEKFPLEQEDLDGLREGWPMVFTHNYKLIDLVVTHQIVFGKYVGAAGVEIPIESLGKFRQMIDDKAVDITEIKMTTEWLDTHDMYDVEYALFHYKRLWALKEFAHSKQAYIDEQIWEVADLVLPQSYAEMKAMVKEYFTYKYYGYLLFAEGNPISANYLHSLDNFYDSSNLKTSFLGSQLSMFTFLNPNAWIGLVLLAFKAVFYFDLDLQIIPFEIVEAFAHKFYELRNALADFSNFCESLLLRGTIFTFSGSFIMKLEPLLQKIIIIYINWVHSKNWPLLETLYAHAHGIKALFLEILEALDEVALRYLDSIKQLIFRDSILYYHYFVNIVLQEFFISSYGQSFLDWFCWFRNVFAPQNFLIFLLLLAVFYFFIGVLYEKVASGVTQPQIFARTIFNFFVSAYCRILINSINFCYFLALLIFFYLDDLINSFRTLPEWLAPFKGLLYISNTIAIDGISFVFCFLSWHIFNKCQQLIRHKTIESQFFFQTALLVTQFSIYLCFLANDLLLFFIGFELASIPMFWLITSSGSRDKKKRAAVFFLLYTLLSSIFLLTPIIYFLAVFQVTDVVLLSSITTEFLTYNQKLFFATCLFIGLAVKIPLVPLHIWLTEAHVEAPTIGSVILAALVLKLGGYGMIKFLFPLFPEICKEYHVIIQSIALMSSIYAAWLALRQTDMKRIIAYSSISHMSFGVISMFTMTNIGLLSGIGLMIGHGFIAAGLFTLAGLLYDRTGTRAVASLNGVTAILPRFGHLFLIFTLANFGFPLTVNFIGEQFALMSLPQQSIGLMLISSLAIILTLAFSLWLFNRINHGTLVYSWLDENEEPVLYDLNDSEFRILSSIAFYVIFFGLFPNIYFGFMRDDVNLLFFFLHK